jgi:hypothetical protein
MVPNMNIDRIGKAVDGHAAGGFAWLPRHAFLHRLPWLIGLRARRRSKLLAGSGALAYLALAGLIYDWDATPNAGTKLQTQTRQTQLNL